MDNETNLTPEQNEAVTAEAHTEAAEPTEIAEETAEATEELNGSAAAAADKPWNLPSNTATEVIYDGDKPWQGTVIATEAPVADESVAASEALPETPEEAEEEYDDDYEYDGRPEEDTGDYVEGEKPWQCKGQGTIAQKYAPTDDQDKPWK